MVGLPALIAGKFAAACFGVFFLGIWTEWLSLLRRQVRVLCRPHAAAVQTVVMCFLYAAQLMFGYFCMLVAMTYQVELFVCVVLGLGTGHAAFNFKPAEVLPGGKLSEAEKILRAAADLDEVVDPCCQYLSLDEDSDHNARPAGLQQQQARQQVCRVKYPFFDLWLIVRGLSCGGCAQPSCTH